MRLPHRRVLHLAFKMGMSKVGMSKSESVSCRPFEEDIEGFEEYLLLPAKHLCRDRRAHEKSQGQCCYVARVRPPRVTLPNAFEQ